MKCKYIEQKHNEKEQQKKTGQVFLSATHESMTLFALEWTDPMAQEGRNFLLQLT